MIMRIPILKSILRNLDWFEEAQKHHKAPEGTIFVGGINHRLKKEDWVEQKHPRADDGKFTSGSGGGSKKPSKTKRKLERRAEAASQGRVSGAIQTLLSGGSALDKIGWLQKPKPELKPETHNSEEEPSILDIINRRNEQAAAMRGKVPGMEHPSQRSAREGAPEGGHSPRVLTQRERDYRDSQNQWDNDRRKMGIPVPGDELATLEIPAKPQQPEKPKAEEKPKSKLYQEMTARGIKAPSPSKMIEPGSAALQLKTDSGVDIPIKVSGYKQNPEITIDPPFTTKTGLRIAGSGQIITTKVNGKPRSVLKINTTKGPAMLTVDTAQIKGAADKLPEKQYAARKVKETINSDGIPIEIERWNIDGGSRTTASGRYLNDSELGDFLDSVGIKDASVKDAIALYEQLMETPEKLQRRKEREAASSARMQHFQDMEDMENARR